MEASLDTVVDLLSRPQFHAGILAGIAAWIVVRTLSTSGRGWGVALSAATIVGINVSIDRRLSTSAGLVLLAAGGVLLERGRDDPDHSPLPWFVLGVGAVLTTLRGGLPETMWIQFAAPVLLLAVGYWMSVWGVLPHRRLVGPLMAITAFGIWATVPDTDSARVLLGASLTLAIATLPREGHLRLSPAGSFPLAGTLIWVAATGGEARHGSIIGAWACVGLLLILPLLTERVKGLPGWLVVGAHVLLIFISSRLFGMWETGASAAAGVLVTSGSFYLLLAFLAGDPERSPNIRFEHRWP